MRLSWPGTLLGRTLATIALVSVGFQLFTLAVIAALMLVPLGQRSADDLAILMVEAARSWPFRAQDGRMERHLQSEWMLEIRSTDRDLPVSDSWLPYRFFIEHALERRTGHPVRLLTSLENDSSVWFWADLPSAGGTVRVGFPRARIGAQPPIALILLLTVGALVTLLTAGFLARRLTAPLERLSSAAKRLGSGDWPGPVDERGPEELASLAESFNRMVRQVRELMANRTTLLAGISHDLRTPMTQIQLALAMLPNDGGDAELMAGIRRDLEHMDRLIAQFLEISRELEAGEAETVAVGALLEELVARFRMRGAVTLDAGCMHCRQTLHALALRRIVSNLLDNAMRYGAGAPVNVICRCNGDGLVIQVLDRGSGIPEHQREAVFQPFYRLEGSRAGATGGSGLGLAIARQLANANGWELRLKPREGGGTAAGLRIPFNPSP